MLKYILTYTLKEKKRKERKETPLRSSYVLSETSFFLYQTGGLVRAEATPTCDEVFGTRSGDTCFSIAQSFGLTTAEFDSINPNLNCAALFVGQWLCVQGSA